MAGISHSAYRRLLASFGGYGALYTEMLPTHGLLAERLATSPYTRRRPEEGLVVYQLCATGKAPVKKAVRRLTSIAPFALDLNLGCPAPMVARKGGGRALFDDLVRCGEVLEDIRSEWNGPFIIKCRLGNDHEGWEERFLERLELFQRYGVDALCVHPRFSHEKLKRKARWTLFPWIRSNWPATLIGNGDMTGCNALDLIRNGHCDGLMVGRAAVTRPWIFRELGGETVSPDYKATWDLFYQYTLEDFPPERAIGRIKEFTAHYAGNFFFGHELFRRIQPAPDLAVIRQRAHAFFDAAPRVMRH